MSLFLHIMDEKIGVDWYRTVCNRHVRADSLVIDPSTTDCPDCRDWFNDDRSAEDVFGDEAHIRQFGPPVKTVQS